MALALVLCGCGSQQDVVRVADGPSARSAPAPTGPSSAADPGGSSSATPAAVDPPEARPSTAPATVAAAPAPAPAAPPAVAPATPPPLQGAWTLVERTRGGAPWPLVEGTQLELELEAELLRWRAGCNTVGAPLRVTPDRFLVGAAETSAVGCPEPLQRQDEELTAFFSASPAWSREAEELVLRDGDVLLRLRRAG